MEVFSILQIFWKKKRCRDCLVKIIVIFILISIITRGRPALIFSVYVGSGPSIYRSSQKVSGISGTPKMFEILGTPKNNPHSVPGP